MTSHACRRLIAVDWGTTNFRAWLVDAHGRVLDRMDAPCGVAQIACGAFVTHFHRLLGRWLHELPADVPVVMAGMVGSVDGLLEVPYLPCPVEPGLLARRLTPVADLDGERSVVIVPGLSAESLSASHDVMRGEEVQIIGALARLGHTGRKLICMPGSHAKWVRVDNEQVLGFSTSMTGEAYAALREHTLLARTIDAQAHDTAAFERGLGQSGRAGGLLHHLFSVRTEVLRGQLSTHRADAYLSGLLIGHEVRAMLAAHDTVGDVIIVGGEPLAALYARALRYFQYQTQRVDGDDAACRGLRRLATLAATLGDEA